MVHSVPSSKDLAYQAWNDLGQPWAAMMDKSPSFQPIKSIKPKESVCPPSIDEEDLTPAGVEESSVAIWCYLEKLIMGHDGIALLTAGSTLHSVCMQLNDFARCKMGETGGVCWGVGGGAGGEGVPCLDSTTTHLGPSSCSWL